MEVIPKRRRLRQCFRRLPQLTKTGKSRVELRRCFVISPQDHEEPWRGPGNNSRGGRARSRAELLFQRGKATQPRAQRVRQDTPWSSLSRVAWCMPFHFSSWTWTVQSPVPFTSRYTCPPWCSSVSPVVFAIPFLQVALMAPGSMIEPSEP